jgi:hypothetical protein
MKQLKDIRQNFDLRPQSLTLNIRYFKISTFALLQNNFSIKDTYQCQL